MGVQYGYVSFALRWTRRTGLTMNSYHDGVCEYNFHGYAHAYVPGGNFET